ncbi:MAG TPA: peptidylprolyl isomerase [Candidatus Krumholzibacteria bacterium]
MGDITIELFRDDSPVTTENFIRYVQDGFYDGLIFHRVIDNFMIQGGGFDANLEQKSTYPPIENEAGNGLSNLRGTVSMARTSVVNSATSQFFINLKDNLFLDHRDDTAPGYGYAVFGRVSSGMDVVDAIGNVPTGIMNGFNDVPVTPVVITRVSFRPSGSSRSGYGFGR